MGMSIDLSCEYCCRSESCHPGELSEMVDRMRSEGWVIWDLFGEKGPKCFCGKHAGYYQTDEKMMAISRVVPETEGCYWATRYGDIYERVFYKAFGKLEWNLLKPSYNKSGYRMVGIRYEGGRKIQKPVHWLVCAAWHGLPDDGRTIVDHINRVRTDNRPENLRWVTPAGNVANKGPVRPLVGFSEDGVVRKFSCGSKATREFPMALAVADGCEWEDQGYLFVDEAEWDKGIQIGVAFEQMREARYGVEEGK